MTEIADSILEIIAGHFKASHVDPARVVLEAHLIEDLGAGGGLFVPAAVSGV